THRGITFSFSFLLFCSLKQPRKILQANGIVRREFLQQMHSYGGVVSIQLGFPGLDDASQVGSSFLQMLQLRFNKLQFLNCEIADFPAWNTAMIALVKDSCEFFHTEADR